MVLLVLFHETQLKKIVIITELLKLYPSYKVNIFSMKNKLNELVLKSQKHHENQTNNVFRRVQNYVDLSEFNMA